MGEGGNNTEEEATYINIIIIMIKAKLEAMQI